MWYVDYNHLLKAVAFLIIRYQILIIDIYLIIILMYYINVGENKRKIFSNNLSIY